MAFKEGHEKKGGRTKGVSNKATVRIRDSFTKLLEGALPQLEDDFKKLEPKDRLKLYLDLAKYVVPTLKQTELTTDPDNPIVIPQITFTKSEPNKG